MNGAPSDGIAAQPGTWRQPAAWTARASSVLARLSGERVARRVFRVYVAVGWLSLLTLYRTKRWFWLDDWIVLAGRDGGDLASVFAPYNGHLLALPIWTYRVLLNVFGLRWTAFLAVVVTLHVALVCVLRVIMRRVGVAPWTSTVVAGCFVLYGAGEEVVLWPFLIERVGAVLFALLQLLLADHDGTRIDRRDALGLVFGLVALMSSGTALVVIVATGAACWVRHGTRRAVVHTAPLAAVYATWYIVAAPYADAATRESVGGMLRFWIEGSITPIRAVTQHDALALALVGIVVAGWVLALRSSEAEGEPRRLRRFAVPLALVTACPAYYLVIAAGRSGFGLDFARGSRYLYVGTALILPAIGVGIDALARRAPGWRLTALAIVLIGVPANIRLLDHPAFGTAFYEHERQVVLGIARDPRLDAAPGWVAFNWPPIGDAHLTVEWLRDARDRGWLPYLGPIDPSVESEFAVRLGVALEPHAWVARAEDCRTRSAPLDLALDDGDRVAIHGPVAVTLILDGEPASAAVAFAPNHDTNVLRAVADHIDVRIGPSLPSSTFAACPLP